MRLPENGVEIIKQMASEGHSEKGIAYALGLARDGLQKLKARPGGELIEQALFEGRQREHMSLRNKLFEKAMAGEVVPLLFLLKSQHGYVEAREAQLPQAVNVQITMPGAMQPGDYAKFIEAVPETKDGVEQISTPRITRS